MTLPGYDAFGIRQQGWGDGSSRFDRYAVDAYAGPGARPDKAHHQLIFPLHLNRVRFVSTAFALAITADH